MNSTRGRTNSEQKKRSGWPLETPDPASDLSSVALHKSSDFGGGHHTHGKRTTVKARLVSLGYSSS